MEQQLHLLHLSSAKSWRGGEQQIAYLASEIQRQKISQIIFCVAEAPLHQWCIQNGIPHLTYTKRASIDPFLSSRIRQICKKEKITHIHAHDSHAHTFAFVAAFFLGNKTPIILSRRVDFPIRDSFFSRLKYNHTSIRKIVCVSHFIRRVIQPVIENQQKLTVIHSGIDVARFQVSRSHELRETYQLASNTKIIINVAALSEHKDHATFVRTAERLLRYRKDIAFFIVGGDSGTEAATVALIAEKGLTEKVILTGYRDNIPSLLAQADVFLFTSREEGLGTSILDAFAAHLPVVATNAGGIPEMVVLDQTGYLARIGNDKELAVGVEKMLDDEDYRMQCVHGATEQLQQFTHYKMAGTTIALYRTVT